MYIIYVYSYTLTFLNEVMLLGVITLPRRATDKWSPSARHGEPPLELLLVKEDQGALVADPEAESKTLLLKMPQIWDTGVRGVKPELRWERPA